MSVLIAGLFGHRRPDDPLYVQYEHAIVQWVGAHWAVLAVVIPVGGAILAGIINHYLALSREKRVRAMDLRAVRARVYADMAARLLAHCSRVATEAESGGVDVEAWRRANAALHARAQTVDVVDALGAQYVGFMAAIDQERRTIDRLADKGVGTTIVAYVPFIAAFGEKQQAARLRKLAGRV